jgi:hypothetical protein
MKLLRWRAFPIQRNGYRYYRYVWKLFGIPVWFWDRYGEKI